MNHILFENEGVRISYMNGIIKKTVIGQNHSKLRSDISPEEMVNREIRALTLLDGVRGVQKYLERDGPDSFRSEYMVGQSLLNRKLPLPRRYFDTLDQIFDVCHRRGVYRIGHNRKDFIICQDESPGVLDFGNVLFFDDPIARIPGIVAGVKGYTRVRVWDLRRRYTE